MKPLVTVPGTISSGTLVPERMIRAFSTMLEHLCKEWLHSGRAVQMSQEELDECTRHLILVGRAKQVAILCASSRSDLGTTEIPGEMVEQLHEALETFAGFGLHFGAHEGDGADIGFWSNHEQPADVQGFLLKQAN